MDGTTPSALLAWVQVLTPVALALGTFWIIVRSQSRHLLVRRLWQLVHGAQDISDPQVKAYVEEETSLATFHMFAGVGVRDLKQAHELLRWTRANDVAMRALRLSGDYFDVEQRRVREEKLPGPLRQRFRLVVALLSWLLLAFCAWAISLDYVPMTLRATGTTRLLSADKARVMWPIWPLGPEALTKSACTARPEDNTVRTGLTPQEIGVLCNVLRSSDAPEHMRKARTDQRWTLVLLIVLLALRCAASMYGWISAEVAIKLAKRNIDPRLDDAQMRLDLNGEWPSRAP